MTRVAKASSMRTRESQPAWMMSCGTMPISAPSQSTDATAHMSAGSAQSVSPLLDCRPSELQDAPYCLTHAAGLDVGAGLLVLGTCAMKLSSRRLCPC